MVVVLSLLGGGSVVASCTTSPSGQVTIDQKALYASGVWVSAIALGLFLRLVNPHFQPSCPYCLGII
jgi:hypothetical protein